MSDASLDQLRSRVGELVLPEDPGYDEARRVLNGMIDRRPTAIARPTDVDGIAAVVDHAREHDLDLAIRGGGHSVPGYGTVDDGIVLDLSLMRAVTVDPGARTARSQGGATWGDFNDATGEHGLATTGGIISTTGVAGLTMGGGIGYLARGHGLSCDNLISAEVVLADGSRVTASEDDHADLLWALRGGGGNFGVAAELEFRLHPLKEIYGGPIFFEIDAMGDLLRWYRDFIADAPDQFGGFPAFQIAPPLPFIPEDRHGRMHAVFVACWAGPVEEGEAMLKPLHDVAPVVAEHVGPMPYPALNSAFDALYPPGLLHYWKANFVKELTDEIIEAHLENGPKAPTVHSTVHVYPINGAAQRVGADATAFGHRDASFATVIVGCWPDAADSEANIAWVRAYHDATAPLSEEGGYVNFMAEDDQGRAPANYGANYQRLVEVKRAYDPTNLFHLNQNIVP